MVKAVIPTYSPSFEIVGSAYVTVTLSPLLQAIVVILVSLKSKLAILSSLVCVPVPEVVKPEVLSGAYTLHLAPENLILGLFVVASTVPVMVG